MNDSRSRTKEQDRTYGERTREREREKGGGRKEAENWAALFQFLGRAILSWGSAYASALGSGSGCGSGSEVRSVKLYNIIIYDFLTNYRRRLSK